METTQDTTNNYQTLLNRSQSLKSGLGAIAWATLEMMKQGGMRQDQLTQLSENMNVYFAKASDDLCNDVCRVVEQRLADDKNNSGTWY